MKKIKLTENQLHKLIENIAAPYQNSVKEYPNSEVTTNTTITQTDGDADYGKPTNTDDVQDTLAIQNYWANAHNGARVMP